MKLETEEQVQTRTQRMTVVLTAVGIFALVLGAGLAVRLRGSGTVSTTNTTAATNTVGATNATNSTATTNASSTALPTVIVEPNQYLPTAPNAFDVFRASDATTAILFLHGGGGLKESVEYALGVKTTDDAASYVVANEALFLDNKLLAVFPQGQTLRPGTRAYTWSNYVMTSGENDLQFLKDLSSYLRTHYKVSRVLLAGHSNGGMMTSRVWCEAPQSFDAYASFAGPPSEHFLNAQTPCTPTVVKPILSVVGGQDDVLQNSDWEAQIWTINPLLTAGAAFLDPTLIGDRAFLPTKAAITCGDLVGPGESEATTTNGTTTWSYCDGKVELRRLAAAGHAMESLQAVAGEGMLQSILGFVAQFFPSSKQLPTPNVTE